jgi:hypothetical protein
MKTKAQLEAQYDNQCHVCATLYASGKYKELRKAKAGLDGILEEMEDADGQDK